MQHESDLSAISWWKWNKLSPTEKRDISTPENEKDEQYDLDNGRHYFGRDTSSYVNWVRQCAAINAGFTTGRVWGLAADVNSFLMDTGISNTRQPLQFPLMQPMLTRLVGQGLKLKVQAKAEATTQRAKSRRETAILKARMMAKAAGAGRDVASAYSTIGIEPDEDKMAQQAEKFFQDPLVKAMNTGLTAMSQMQELEQLKKQLITNLSLSGIGAMHSYARGANMFWEVVETDDLLFDPYAKRSDLSDGDFMGMAPLMGIPHLCERYRAKRTQLKHIEKAVKSYGNDQNHFEFSQWPTGMPRVYIVYYKDGRYEDRGFIQGPNGPEMVSIGEIDPDTQKPRYTEADLIDPPQNAFNNGWTGKTDTRFVENLRYCVFIPREYMPPIDFNTGEKLTGEQKATDLVLESGIYKLQESDPDKQHSVKFPIKCCTWMNIGGFIVAPLTAAQSPQRVINQITTDIVWRMSKAPLPSIQLDRKSITQGGGTVLKAIQAIKNGNPLVMDSTHVGGIPQAAQMLNVGLDPNIFKQFEILEQLVKVAEDAVGLYKDNFGAPGSANQLVGVKQLQLQQSSIMQQPFFDAIQSMFEQVHQFNAQAGRQFYIRHPWVLQDMVGDENFNTIMATKDMELEQFRVKTQLSLDPEEIKRIADESILMQGGFLDRQLLGPEEAASLLGHSYPEDVNAAMVEFTRRRAMAQQKMQEEQAQAAQITEAKAQEQSLMEQEANMYDKAMDMATQADATNEKAKVPIRAALAKNLEPEAAMA